MFKEHVTIRLIYYASVMLIFSLVVWAFYVLAIPILLAFLLAFLTAPIVDLLEREGVTRPRGSAIAFLLIGLLLYITFNFVTPLVNKQVGHFQNHQEEYLLAFETKLHEMKTFSEGYISPAKMETLEEEFKKLVYSKITDLQKQIPIILGSILSAAGTFIFVPIIAFFFLVEGIQIKKFFVALLPNRYFEMTLMIIHQVNSQLGSYIRGQIMDCLVIGVLAFIGLSMIGVKGALAIGLFAGIANAVPYLGPVMGAVPAILVLLLDQNATSPWWYVPIVFLIVNLADNAVVYPMTVGKSLSLHPLIVILGILFGGSVGGVAGMILAVPLIGISNRAFQVLHSSLKSYRII